MKKLTLVALLLLSVAALADVTITYISANAAVDSITFTMLPGGAITHTECGHANAGGTSPVTTCTPPVVIPAGAFLTTVQNLFANQGLTAYKNANGL